MSRARTSTASSRTGVGWRGRASHQLRDCFSRHSTDSACRSYWSDNAKLHAPPKELSAPKLSALLQRQTDGLTLQRCGHYSAVLGVPLEGERYIGATWRRRLLLIVMHWLQARALRMSLEDAHSQIRIVEAAPLPVPSLPRLVLSHPLPS
jgi:hypothetical protein